MPAIQNGSNTKRTVNLGGENPICAVDLGRSVGGKQAVSRFGSGDAGPVPESLGFHPPKILKSGWRGVVCLDMLPTVNQNLGVRNVGGIIFMSICPFEQSPFCNFNSLRASEKML